MRIIAIATCAVSVACSSPAPSGGTTVKANACVTAGASYQVRYAEDPSGTCGPIQSSIAYVQPDGTLTAEASCTDRGRYDGCDVYIDSTCVVKGVTVVTAGKITWSSDGKSGTGKESYSLSGSSTCTSTYTVTATRL